LAKPAAITGSARDDPPVIRTSRSDFTSRSLGADIVLGLFEGLDNALWGYGFATILFAGVLSVFLPLGITIILTGWALFGLFVAMTSKSRVHMTSLDEQAVVILGATFTLLPDALGNDVTGARGLSTMLALMGFTALAVSTGFILVGRYRLTRLLELLPYPVICGFMAGVGWLLLNAAIFVTTGENVSMALADRLGEPLVLSRLLVTLGCGALISLFVLRTRQAWSLPVAALVVVAGFYAVVLASGTDHDALRDTGWLFDVQAHGGTAMELLGSVSLYAVDAQFILSALPAVLTIVFLSLLNTSMSLSAMDADSRLDLDISTELRQQGAGNLLCAMVACPPGNTDVAASILYEDVGASSRWMPITAALICLSVAIFGTGLIAYMPKLLVAATIFFFAFKLLVEWLYENVRGFQAVDFAIVCIILGMVIFVGFLVGVLAGVVLTLLLFVMRYSMISAIQGAYSLSDFRSSVERPSAANQELDQHGGGALIYTLRGFLFFGTANAILARIKHDLNSIGKPNASVLLDFKRVTGIDISALKTFAQLRGACELMGAHLFYSGVRDGVEDKIEELGAVSIVDGAPMFFTEMDFALEYMEEQVLGSVVAEGRQKGVREHLEGILPEREKVELLLAALRRVECPAGQALFSQGDPDTGFYILHGSGNAVRV
jgi:SulP family sulfate permease